MMDKIVRRITKVLRNPKVAFQFALDKITAFTKKLAVKVLHKFDTQGVFSSCYSLPSSVTKVYTEIPASALSQERSRDQKITLIATCFNERSNVQDWFASVRSQTFLPDELVVVDGGSNDGTVEYLKEQASRLPFPCKIVVEQNVNIARGRNIAIENASNEIIACTDFGCVLDKKWLQNITYPFYDNKEIEVVAGFYTIAKDSRLRMRLLGPSSASVVPDTFLPSSRSLAFRKTSWKKAGGYPEWLSLTGEDTIFAVNLRIACPKWAFVSSAIVEWKAPSTMSGYWRKIFEWSKGDGESSFGSSLYYLSLLRILALFSVGLFLILINVFLFCITLSFWSIVFISILSLITLYLISSRLLFGEKILRIDELISEIGAELMRVHGYLLGARNRPAAIKHRFQKVQGFFIILAGVPIDDTGGGSRGAQLAWELLHQGHAVLYLNAFPKYESVDLPINKYHPNLVNMSFEDYFITHHYRLYEPLISEKPFRALVEFPLPQFLSHIEWLKDRGVKIVYDCIDNWETSLGAQWYSRQVEKQIVEISDVLIATEKSLFHSLTERYQKKVTLLPNAVNLRIFDHSINYPTPDDLPDSLWKSIYIGALWGDWFDWDLLRKTAEAYPDMALIVIGDYRGQGKSYPPNIHFLGLKPQYVLPSYLKSADVCLIPWKITSITQATDPLKVYEYLAMHKPVVAPLLEPLRNIPGVWLANDEDEFVRLVRDVLNFPLPTDQINYFIAQNNWTRRVKQLIDVINAIE
jgi:glycosyltransferase involved in cell wall biosynthesis